MTKILGYERSVENRITLSYFFALGIIAALSLVSYLLIHYLLYNNTHSAAVLNISGRQRMLSQRIAQYVLRISMETNKAKRIKKIETAEALLDDFITSHENLSSGKIYAGNRKNSEAINQLYFGDRIHLDQDVQWFAKRVKAFIETSRKETPDDKSCMDISIRADTILPKLNAVVAQFQNESEKNTSRAIWFSTSTFLISILVLLSEVRLIFLPLTKSIKQSEKQLQQTIVSLEMKNEKLKTSESKYKALFDESPIMYLNVSFTSGTIRDVNDKLVESLSYKDKSELIGKPVLDFFHPDHRSFAKKLLEDFFSDGQMRNRHLEVVRRDGSSIPIVLDATRVYTGSQEAVGFMTWIDISQLKHTENELFKLNLNLETTVQRRTDDLIKAQVLLQEREKKELFSRMACALSHELNNPLQVVNANIQLLRAKLLKNDEDSAARIDRIFRQLAIIESTMQSIATITNLDHSNPGYFNLVDLVQRVRCSSSCECEIAGNIPDSFGDETQIELAVSCLIRNAIESTDGGPGRVALKVYQDGSSQNVVEISDKGGGIPEELRQEIFKPFFSTKPKGIGMGLAVCKLICDINNCRLDWESEVGRGTSFRLWMPCRPVNQF